MFRKQVLKVIKLFTFFFIVGLWLVNLAGSNGFCGVVKTGLPASFSTKTVNTTPEVVFPADAGFINVKKSFGAKGDGITDDTSAINQAIHTAAYTNQTIYFPPGVYLVFDQLQWRDAANHWASNLTWQGAGIGRTVIRLRDGAKGFNDKNNPKAVIVTASKTNDPACSNYGKDDGDGGGNCAFGNYLYDFTVDVGRANPGAVGIDFIASNYGGMENIEIKSEDGLGSLGLSLKREVGPALLKDITVRGFDVGIEASRELYGITLENITLSNQSVAGLRNSDNALAIHNLNSKNTVPAVVNSGIGNIVLINANLDGGANGKNAIENDAVLLARDITTSGYGSAIRSKSSLIRKGFVKEYISDPILSQFPSPKRTLSLPIKNSPEFTDHNINNWANVEKYGARKNDGADDTVGIQAAIDSGKSTVYLPFGKYIINGTVHVRGSVKRIIGFMSQIEGSGKPSWIFDKSKSPAVVMERFATSSVENRSNQAVVMKHVLGGDYHGSGRGDWFLEDYCCGNVTVNRQNTWLRQLNLEAGGPMLTNNGGRVWILGLKTEHTTTLLKTTAGGYTELLGGIGYATGGDKRPAFIIQDASMSLNFSEVAYAENNLWKTIIQETRGGVTKNLPQSVGSFHGWGRIIPLYAGYTSSAALGLPRVPSLTSCGLR